MPARFGWRAITGARFPSLNERSDELAKPIVDIISCDLGF